jgi:putative N6-adenine-specific DNA methylase
MDWPDFDETLWGAICGQSAHLPAHLPLILASDRDAGAIQMSQANAGRAGVSERIEFKCQAVSSVAPPPGPGWVVTNPPYGQRLSQGGDLRNLYAQFGNILREKCPAWHLSVLCNDLILLGQMQVKLDTSLSMVTGGIPVRLARGVVP